MSKERYTELMNNTTLSLTAGEYENGWHFCNDWDDLLIHRNWPEAECCTCQPTKDLVDGK